MRREQDRAGVGMLPVSGVPVPVPVPVPEFVEITSTAPEVFGATRVRYG